MHAVWSSIQEYYYSRINSITHSIPIKHIRYFILFIQNSKTHSHYHIKYSKRTPPTQSNLSKSKLYYLTVLSGRCTQPRLARPSSRQRTKFKKFWLKLHYHGMGLLRINHCECVWRDQSAGKPIRIDTCTTSGQTRTPGVLTCITCVVLGVLVGRCIDCVRNGKMG